ncbi:hypothetical protein J6590_053120 [Homalodisca vitripennis]|nr:hypothetical protein J6590_053120 [Homalodisca vitripennis]
MNDKIVKCLGPVLAEEWTFGLSQGRNCVPVLKVETHKNEERVTKGRKDGHDDNIGCDDSCELWFHIGCVQMSESEYSKYASDNRGKWFCNWVDCIPCDENPYMKLSNQFAGLIQSVANLSTKDEITSIVNGIEKLREGIKLRLTKVESRVDLESVVMSLQNQGHFSNCCLEDTFKK